MESSMQSATVESTPKVPVQKFSRYRSVRKAASQPLDVNKSPLPSILRSNATLTQQYPAHHIDRIREGDLSRGSNQPARRVTDDPTSLAALEGRNPSSHTSNTSKGTSSRVVEQSSNGPRRTDERIERGSPRTTAGSPSRQEHDKASRDRSKSDNGRQPHEISVSQSQSPRRYSLLTAKGSESAQKDLPGAVLLNNDAPISAVNAGDRKVNVLWDDDVVELTITPDTTTRQLLAAASARLSRPNDPDLILLESFSQLGLERPIRQYEHIRDIMNSWDRDDLNALMVKRRASDSRANGLTTLEAPKMQPDGQSVSMYYSQRPGKWDKRYVSLASNGQVTVAKREGAETMNICHMSDFDIYIPTRRQLKKLRPPKSCCLAIKSQQKSAVFLNGANFVHFFSTADEHLANKWYDAVQIWRSWHLADTLDLHNHQIQVQRSHTMKRRNSLQAHDLRPSINNISTDISNSGRPDIAKSRLLQRSKPPCSFPQTMASNSDPAINQSPQLTENSTFAPDSLLGRSYTTRRPRAATNSQPMRRPTVRSSSRTRHPEALPGGPKPLVDLTPVFQEPPQHSRKGRGVPAEPGTFLVENAMNRDNIQPAIPVPTDAAVFRRADGHVPHVSSHDDSPTGPVALPHRRASMSHRPKGDGTKRYSGTSHTPHVNVNKHGVTTTKAGDNDDDDWDTPLGDLKMRAARVQGR